jgi:hypothetical protein
MPLICHHHGPSSWPSNCPAPSPASALSRYTARLAIARRACGRHACASRPTLSEPAFSAALPRPESICVQTRGVRWADVSCRVRACAWCRVGDRSEGRGAVAGARSCVTRSTRKRSRGSVSMPPTSSPSAALGNSTCGTGWRDGAGAMEGDGKGSWSGAANIHRATRHCVTRHRVTRRIGASRRRTSQTCRVRSRRVRRRCPRASPPRPNRSELARHARRAAAGGGSGAPAHQEATRNHRRIGWGGGAVSSLKGGGVEV